MKSLINKIKKQVGKTYLATCPPKLLSLLKWLRRSSWRGAECGRSNVGETKCNPAKPHVALQRSQGIALVEVIAALGIAVVVITALVSLSIFTLRSSLRSKLMLEGTKIANRELELVRAYRDTNTWDDFTEGVASCEGSDCSMDLSGTVVNYSSTVQGSGVEAITRSFTVNFISLDMVRVNVVVTWNIGGDVKAAYLYTDLTNWRAR